MSPQHNVGLEVDADANNHWNNGFEVLKVIVEEEGSGNQVRLCCFGAAIHAVTFLFDGCPASSSIRELSTTIHDRFNDVMDGIELI